VRTLSNRAGHSATNGCVYVQESKWIVCQKALAAAPIEGRGAGLGIAEIR